ncbi:MAG: DUF6868 family protein [Akkermansiaceae bacterium]
MTVETIARLESLLGYCTLLSGGLLILTTIALTLMKGAILKIHSKLTGLTEEQLNKGYFDYLSNFKIVFLMFNLIPYIALRLM